MVRAVHQSAQRYPLTLILGTDAGVRLARELALHGGQLAAPDLVRRTGLAKASVARGLAILEAAGAVRTAGTGRSVLYSLRQEHPLCPALVAAFEAEDQRFQALLTGVKDAARSAVPGLVALWLFGSVARGEDREDSDLDLVLAIDNAEHCRDEPGSLPGGNCKAMPAEQANAFRDQVAVIGERVGFVPSVVALSPDDVVRLSVEHDPWWHHVARDAIALIGERPEPLAAWLIRRNPSDRPRAAALERGKSESTSAPRSRECDAFPMGQRPILEELVGE